MRKYANFCFGLVLIAGFYCTGVFAAAANVTVTTAVVGVAPTTVTAGGTANINLTVTDTVAASTSNVTISVALPVGMTLNGTLTTPQSSFTASGTTTITFANAAFTSTTPVTLSIPVIIAASQTADITIAAPTVTFTDSSTKNPAPAGATVAVAVSADLQLSLLLDPQTINPGLSRTVRVRITNAGPSDAKNVILSLAKPAGISAFNLVFGGGGTGAGSAVNFNNTLSPMTLGYLTIPASTQGSVNVSVYDVVETIPVSTPDGMQFVDTFTVTSDTADPVAGNNTIASTATTKLVTDLGIAITAGTNPVVAGQTRSMTVTVTNNGPNDATGVSFTFNTPAGTTFQSLTKTSGVTPTNIAAPAAGSGGTVTVTIGAMANAATSVYSYVENVLPTAPVGNITDSMTVSSATLDTTVGNNTAPSVFAVSQAADLALTISNTVPGVAAPANSVAVGDTITYTYSLSNAGPSAAPATVVTLGVPANTTFVSATQLTGPAGFTQASVGAPVTSVTFSTGATSYGPGAANNATFQLVVRVNQGLGAGTTITENATATTTVTNTAGNDAPSKTLSTVINSDMSIKNVASATTFTTPKDVTYMITVTNNGPTNATGVSFSDTMAANTQFLSLTQTSGPAFSLVTPAVNANGPISGTLAAMNSGAEAVFALVIRYPATITPPANLTNISSVSSTTADLTAANNSATVAATIAQTADTGVVVTANPNPVVAGNFLTYTCTVSNSGPNAATNAVFSFPFPNNVVFSSVSVPTGWTKTSVNNFADTTGTITATLPSFPVAPAAGSTAVFVIVFAVNANATAATPITNTVTISSSVTEPQPNTNPNSAVVSIPVQPRPTVSIANLSFNEGDTGTTVATFNVTYSGANAQTMLVDFQTVDGTATAPANYTAQSGRITYNPGDPLVKTIAIQVATNALVEPDRAFTIHLSNPIGCTLAVGGDVATGTIVNDDIGGVIEFSAPNFNVAENAGTANVLVTRPAGANAAATTVDYVTSDGTAVAGVDYTAVSGTLTFGLNEQTKPIAIPLLNKLGANPNATVNVTLSNPQSGPVVVPGASASLGSQSSATLTILAAPAFSSPLLVSSAISQPFSYTLAATGQSPITLALPDPSTLPLGLSYAAGFITGIPVQIGTFMVPLTATNSVATTTQTLVIEITAVPLAPGASNTTRDSDGDGFADELEIAAGTSPFDLKMTPINNQPARIQGISNVKLAIGLNFSRGKSDTVQLSGALALPIDFGQSGKLVYFDVGGVVRRFALDSTGASTIGSDSVKFKLPKSDPSGAGVSGFKKVVSFSLTIKNADAVALLADEGLTNSFASGTPVTVPVLVMLNDSVYTINQSQAYSARPGRTGRSRNP